MQSVFILTLDFGVCMHLSQNSSYRQESLIITTEGSSHFGGGEKNKLSIIKVLHQAVANLWLGPHLVIRMFLHSI